MRVRVRTVWVRVHRWIALVLGAGFVLLGLTGSALVFHREIDAWLNPDVSRAVGGGAWQPLDRIVAAAEAAHPGTLRAGRVELPRGADGVPVVRFEEPVAGGEGVRYVEVPVDPYTATALGLRVEGGSLMTWIHQLHRSFHLGGAGETAVGILGLLLVVSLLSGVYLWWPTLRTGWRRALTVKRETSAARRDRDVHNVGGVYTVPLVLVVVLAGTYLTFDEQLHPVLARAAPVTPFPSGIVLRPAEAAVALSMEEAARRARSRFPGAEITFFWSPRDRQGVYRFVLRDPGDGVRGGRNMVWIDPYTGRVLAARDPRHFTVADHLDGLVFSLHNGEALGAAGRWLVFLSGVVPLLLYVTGLRIWWRKRGGRVRRADALAVRTRSARHLATVGGRPTRDTVRQR